MVDANSFYGKKELLKAEDINESTTLVIESADIKNLAQDGEPEEKKIVLSFVGFEKGLALNVTNAKTISKVADTPETDRWPGNSITLFKGTVETEGKFKGKPCIRVKEAQ